MKTFLIGSLLGLLTLLVGCDEKPPEYIYVTPDVPAELIAPVEVPARPVEGLQSVGLILADHVEALEQANSDKETIGCILDASAEKTSPAETCAETEP